MLIKIAIFVLNASNSVHRYPVFSEECHLRDRSLILVREGLEDIYEYFIEFL